MTFDRMQQFFLELAGDRAATPDPRPIRKKLELRLGSECAIDPDEIEVLRAIAGDVDDARSESDAWAIIDNVRLAPCFETPTDRDPVMRAIGQHLQKFTFAFVRSDKRTHDVSSGTLVDIDGRCFVATAAHAIPKNPNGKLSFVPRVTEDVEKTCPTIIGYAKGESDVGFLEISPTFVKDVLNREFISLERAMDVGTGIPTTLCYLIGYPAETTTVDRDPPNVFTFHLTGQCYANKLIQPADWRDEWTDAGCQAEVDLFLPYDCEAEHVSRSEISCDRLPLPFGKSGGGYWQNSSSSGLWSPENYRLIGIQSSRCRNERILRGVQIRKWVELVKEHNPDLAGFINERFQIQEMNAA